MFLNMDAYLTFVLNLVGSEHRNFFASHSYSGMLLVHGAVCSNVSVTPFDNGKRTLKGGIGFSKDIFTILKGAWKILCFVSEDNSPRESE